MTSRALLAGLVAAASVALGVTPTAAQNDESILAGAEIDVSGYPAAELVVSLPAGFGSDDDGPAFLVTENGQTIEPEVSALSTTELDVVLAIDTSGSMSGGALDAARTAALAFATELPDQARIGLVGFGPEPVVALPLTGDREAFVQRGLKKYDNSFRRKLILGVYVVPLGIIAFLVYYSNFM